MPSNSFENYFLSWKPDRGRLSRPVYLALANALEEDIRNGILPAGLQLPPQRELADYLEINFTTVTRAYELCRKKNLIYGIIGKGSFVAPLSNENSVASKHEINLGLIRGFDSVVSPVVDSAREVFEKTYLNELFTYAEPTGYKHQRIIAQNWMEQLGVKADFEQTLIFSGAQNIISTALLALFKVGDRIAVDGFTYVNLIDTAKLFHIQLVPVAGDQDGMKPELLDEICRETKITGIFLMPNCANPTTITIPEHRRIKLAEVIKRRNLIVLEDDTVGGMEAYRECIPLYSLLPEQTIFIAGSTKCLCSGLRVAFAAIPYPYLKKMITGMKSLNIKTSSLDAEIMTQIIVSGRWSALMKKKQMLAEKANQCFERIFPEEKQETFYPSFFRWLPLKQITAPGIKIEQQLAMCGVQVLHSYHFQTMRGNHDAFLRLSLSSAVSEQYLSKGLNIIKEWRQENLET